MYTSGIRRTKRKRFYSIDFLVAIKELGHGRTWGRGWEKFETKTEI